MPQNCDVRTTKAFRRALCPLLAAGLLLASATSALAVGGSGNPGSGTGTGTGGTVGTGGGSIAWDGTCASPGYYVYLWLKSEYGPNTGPNTAAMSANVWPAGKADVYQTGPYAGPMPQPGGPGGLIPSGYTWSCISAMTVGFPAFPGFGTVAPLPVNSGTFAPAKPGPALVFQPVDVKITSTNPYTCVQDVDIIEAAAMGSPPAPYPKLTPLPPGIFYDPFNKAAVTPGDHTYAKPGCPGSVVASQTDKTGTWTWAIGEQVAGPIGGVTWTAGGGAAACTGSTPPGPLDMYVCFQHVGTGSLAGVSAKLVWQPLCWGFVWDNKDPAQSQFFAPSPALTRTQNAVTLTCDATIPQTFAGGPGLTIQQIEPVAG